jgi:ABC-2 type transport system permease protein
MSQIATLTRAEARLFGRDWAAVFFVFALPLGLLSVFSLISDGDVADPENSIPASFLPTMSIGIGIGILGLGTLGVALATYRERGVLRRLSTTPVRPFMVLVAQLMVHLVAAVAVIGLVVGVGAVAFDAELPAGGIAFVATALLYCLSTFSIGLLLSALLPTGKAVTIAGNVLLFPFMFFAGVWTPGDLMPENLRFLRDTTPMGAGMSAMQDAWAGSWPDAVHVVSMLAVTVVCLGVAARYFRWE